MNSLGHGPPRYRLFATILLTGLCSVVALRADERFNLLLPENSRVRSSAILGADELIITDAEGIRFVYVRQGRLDSPDGDFLAFYCDAARQYLRWPKNGTGSMHVGAPDGRSVSWKQSQMRIQRIGDKPGVGGGPLAGALAVAGPMHVNAITDRNGDLTMAHVDERGQLQFYQGKQGRWSHSEAKLTEALDPGASIALVEDPRSNIPLIYAVNVRGEFLEISDGQRVRYVAGRSDPTLTRGTHVEVISRGAANFAVVSDDRGRIWDLDLDRGRHRMIERREGIYLPGQPIAYLDDAGGRIFLIDRTGTLTRYELDRGAWAGPFRVAAGFVPGGSLDAVLATPAGATKADVHVSSIDATGRLRLVRAGADERIGNSLLPPGSPVALATNAGGVSVSAIQPDGRWTEWYQRSANQWDQREIADGFPTNAPISLHASGAHAFAVDRTGRVVAGQLVSGRWQCAICSPRFNLAPRLVRREITPNEPLEPANVLFTNHHKEDLLVRIFDARLPDHPMEFKVPAGQTKTQRIDRDSGATLEEVYLVPGPRGVVEEVHRHRLPPARFYDVAVYEDKVTSVYFDRTTNKTDKPDEVTKSLVSLGMFPLAPGEQLREGDELDVYKQAVRQQNPGAVRLFEQP